MKSFLYKTQIRKSVKESFDNLPKGLCFFYPNGIPILINHKMYDLCYEITGKDLQNGKAFWEYVKFAELKSGKRLINKEKSVVICLNESKYLNFKLDEIKLYNAKAFELSVADVTMHYALAEQIKKENEALADLGRRLKKYNSSIIAITQKQEYLETKMRVHNEMGQALVKSRYALKNEASSLDEELDSWNDIISMLKLSIEPKAEESPLNYFLNAAESIGVRVNIMGDIPKEKSALQLIAVISGEVLTNAVRHASATELNMEITNEEKQYIIKYKNNGKRPESQIVEGGGLTSLRMKIEASGGYMKVEGLPEFCLTVGILRGGDEIGK